MDEQRHLVMMDDPEFEEKQRKDLLRPLPPGTLAILDTSTGIAYDVNNPEKVEAYNKRVDELRAAGAGNEELDDIMQYICDKKVRKRNGLHVGVKIDATKKRVTDAHRRKKRAMEKQSRKANRK